MPIIINDNFNVNAPRSIDSRLVLNALSDAIALDVNYNYPNMVIWIKSEKAFYYLKDGQTGDQTSHWQKLEMSGSAGTGGAGSSGTSGGAGSSGTSGSAGSSGSSGTSGTNGVNGSSGTSGGAGSSGTSGSAGSSGTSGKAGSSGTSGVGSSGTSGSGSSGTSGGVGSSGTSGSSGSSPVVSTLDILELDAGVLSTLYNTSVPDSMLSNAVGGAPATAASIWKTRNIVQVLDAILFPVQNPTYLIPTLTISPSGFTNGQVLEIGTNITPVLTLTGTKNAAGPFTGLTINRNSSTAIGTITNPTGSAAPTLVTQFGYTDPNNPNFSYALTATDTSTSTVPAGQTLYAGTSVYGAGVAKKDSFGDDDARAFATRSTNAPQAASSTLASSSVTFTGVYPWYWGISSTQLSANDILALLNNPLSSGVNKVIADSSGTITVNDWGATGQYLWFATPASSTTKMVWYVNDSNTSAIGGTGSTNLFNAPTTLTVTGSRPAGYWTNISYKIYPGGYPTSHKGVSNLPAMQLRNS